MGTDAPLLDVVSLQTYFYAGRDTVRAVDGVSFRVYPEEIVAIIGESGCGKTMSAYSVLRLVRPPGKIVGGEVNYGGTNLLALTESEMRRIRGKEISIVFQEPGAAFDPIDTVGHQIVETIREHESGISHREASAMAAALLASVSIPDATRRLHSYPFQLSGGMLQRAMIALAMSSEAKLLIADEPTTSLDATTQLQVLELLAERAKAGKVSVVLITHNLGLVARYASRVYVMYAGKVVESGSVEDICREPLHPYTGALWACVPSLNRSKNERPVALAGSPPSLAHLPPGCSFSPRCVRAKPRCFEREPALVPLQQGREVACHAFAG